MIWLALAAIGTAAIEAFASASIFRSLIRQQARERDLLLNQVMHLSGRTWTPPPASRETVPPAEPRRTVTVPEHWPDDHNWAEE